MPTWRVALADGLRQRQVVEATIRRFRDRHEGAPRPLALLLTGAGGEGKSTALLQVAASLVRDAGQSWTCLRREAMLDTGETVILTRHRRIAETACAARRDDGYDIDKWFPFLGRAAEVSWSRHGTFVPVLDRWHFGLAEHFVKKGAPSWPLARQIGKALHDANPHDPKRLVAYVNVPREAGAPGEAMAVLKEKAQPFRARRLRQAGPRAARPRRQNPRLFPEASRGRAARARAGAVARHRHRASVAGGDRGREPGGAGQRSGVLRGFARRSGDLPLFRPVARRATNSASVPARCLSCRRAERSGAGDSHDSLRESPPRQDRHV